jgi:hypothetical protein
MTYQNLQNYRGSLYGSPQYLGIEYDPEVPDNMVISSPGGVASTMHDWTKGFYGYGGSSWDFYAGQGQRYPHAEHANLYQYGQNAPHHMGYYTKPPDAMFTQNMYRENPMFNRGDDRDNFQYIPQHDLPSTPPTSGGGPQRGTSSSFDKTPTSIPNPNGPDDIPLTPVTPVTLDIKCPKRLQQINVATNPIIIFIFLIIAYVALDMWSSAGHDFVLNKLNKGVPMTWKSYMFYAIVITLILFGLTYFIGFPLIQIEEV